MLNYHLSKGTIIGLASSPDLLGTRLVRILHCEVRVVYQILHCEVRVVYQILHCKVRVVYQYIAL